MGIQKRWKIEIEGTGNWVCDGGSGDLTETKRCDMIICVGRSKFLFRRSFVPPVPQ